MMTKITIGMLALWFIITCYYLYYIQQIETFDAPEQSAAKMNEVIDLKQHDEEGLVTAGESTQTKVNKKQTKGKNKIDKNYNDGQPTEREFSGLGGGDFDPVDEASEVFDDIMNGVEDGVDAVGKGFGAGWEFTTDLAKKGADAVWGGLQDAGGAIKDGANVVGGGIKDGANAVGNFFCFSGDTPIKLSNGTTALLKEIDLDDVLVNGSTVIATLRIRSNKDNPFYQIYSKELSNYIYVTGSHYIKNDDKFIHVRDFDEAEKLDTVHDILYCLVTSDHTIPVGEFTFWDWEDNLLE